MNNNMSVLSKFLLLWKTVSKKHWYSLRTLTKRLKQGSISLCHQLLQISVYLSMVLIRLRRSGTTGYVFFYFQPCCLTFHNNYDDDDLIYMQWIFQIVVISRLPQLNALIWSPHCYMTIICHKCWFMFVLYLHFNSLSIPEAQTVVFDQLQRTSCALNLLES